MFKTGFAVKVEPVVTNVAVLHAPVVVFSATMVGVRLKSGPVAVIPPVVNEAVPVDGHASVRVIASFATGVPVTESEKLAPAPVPVPGTVVAVEVSAAVTVGVEAAEATPAPTIDRPPNRVTPVRAATPHRRIDGNLFIGPPWAFCPEENQGFHNGHLTSGDQHLLLLPREHR
jgi:hypothetical protein